MISLLFLPLFFSSFLFAFILFSVHLTTLISSSLTIQCLGLRLISKLDIFSLVFSFLFSLFVISKKSISCCKKEKNSFVISFFGQYYTIVFLNGVLAQQLHSSLQSQDISLRILYRNQIFHHIILFMSVRNCCADSGAVRAAACLTRSFKYNLHCIEHIYLYATVARA